MQLRDVPLPSLVLGLIAGWALLVAIVAVAGLGGRVGLHPDDPAHVPSVPRLDLSQVRTDLPAMDRYAEVAQRPLFNADRRPLPPEEVGGEEEAPPPPTPLEVTLTSVIISGDVKIAMVQDNRSRQSQSVRLGQNLEGEMAGWKLVELAPRKAVFEGPAGRAEADLRVFDGSGGQAPTALTAVQPVMRDSGARPEDGSAVQPEQEGEVVQVATETPESRAELIRRRIEERRRQMREAAARANEPKQE